METTERDLEHLRLLSIFHYVFAGLTALGGVCSLFYVAMGFVFLSGGSAMMPPPRPGMPSGPPPEFMGWMFIGMGAAVSIFAWLLAAGLAYSGMCISRRRHWLYCAIISGVICLSVPLGTILGVFTLIVLTRDSVKALFRPVQPAAWTSPGAIPERRD